MKTKNVHILKTNEPSRLGRFVDTGNLFLRTPNDLPRGENVNVYITDDTQVKWLDFYYNPRLNKVFEVNHANVNQDILTKHPEYYSHKSKGWEKVIMTDNPTLIDSGVQAIPNDFLEFLVQNPSCESVEVELFPKFSNNLYGIIIPKEDTKQETNFFESLQKYFKETPREKVLEDWAKSAEFDNVSSGGESIEEAAERIWLDSKSQLTSKSSFIAGAKSDAARDYWFSQFKKSKQ